MNLDALRGVRLTLSLLVRENQKRAWIAITLALLGALSGPLIGLSLAHLTDAAIDHDTTQAVVAGTFAGLFAVIGLTMEHFAFNVMAMVGDKANIVVDAELITMVQGTADLANHEDSAYADRLSLLQDEIGGLTYTVNDVIQTLAILVQMVLTMVLLGHLQLVLLILPVVAVVPYAASRYAHRVREAAMLATADTRRRARFLIDLVQQRGPAQEIRLAGLEHELRRRQRDLYAAEAAALTQAEMKAAWVRTAGQIVFAVAYAIALIIVVRHTIAGNGSVGDVILAIFLASQVNTGITQLLTMAGSVQLAMRIGARWEWLRAAGQRARPVDEGSSAPTTIAEGIRLDHVSFRYPGAPSDALHDVSLSLPAGSVVALVGDNGAGKTTLVKLLCKLYEPITGTITIDGSDLADIAAVSWQSAISAAFQDFAQLEFRVRETVGVGDLARIGDETRVHDAMTRSGADTLLPVLTLGLDTEVGTSLPDGTELSGGQWQKLALARAMMRTAPLLLVLDEPTANLDPSAEHALFDRHTEMARTAARTTGAITVLVSHRFSTVSTADQIIVLDGGRIREHGTHAELLVSTGAGTRGSYAEMFELQARNYRDQKSGSESADTAQARRGRTEIG